MTDALYLYVITLRDGKPQKKLIDKYFIFGAIRYL